jgi:hypothetical protein
MEANLTGQYQWIGEILKDSAGNLLKLKFRKASGANGKPPLYMVRLGHEGQEKYISSLYLQESEAKGIKVFAFDSITGQGDSSRISRYLISFDSNRKQATISQKPSPRAKPWQPRRQAGQIPEPNIIGYLSENFRHF